MLPNNPTLWSAYKTCNNARVNIVITNDLLGQNTMTVNNSKVFILKYTIKNTYKIFIFLK